MATMTKDLLGNTFKGLEDLLVDFVTKGTFEFKKFAQSIINEMARIAIRQAVMKPLTGWFGNIFSAKGNAFENGKHLTAYAKGGVIDKPHYKFMANGGIAVAGEAGSEAVLPLRRGKSGRLGVESSGGGTSVVVNVDASGDTQVTGNEQQARMLGQLVAAAVKTQIANERRPGGLLYA
jgi:phage-related minor tail protein